MSKIKDIIARQILDSRGNPTIEVDVHTFQGSLGRASVPSGASKGKYEAHELRDGGHDFFGKGVKNAISKIDLIKDNIINSDVLDQKYIDKTLIKLDGTADKSDLGANTILAISLACAKAAAEEMGVPLFKHLHYNSNFIMPIPQINLINGGCHADNNLNFQEFMIVPKKANNFSHALQISSEIFHTLGNILKQKKLSVNVGDEGGYAPYLTSEEEALELLLMAIDKSKYKPGEDIFLAIDAAANEFFDSKKNIYYLKKSDKKYTTDEFINYWENLINNYPIISLEDPLAEDDWNGWQALTKSIGDKIQIVGDDLYTTNPSRLEIGIQSKATNAILVKINQIGTISETIEVIKTAKKANFGTIISHRSGETEDTSIADISVGLGMGQIKCGSMSRTDRIAKYNQLLRIEELVKKNCIYGMKS